MLYSSEWRTLSTCWRRMDYAWLDLQAVTRNDVVATTTCWRFRPAQNRAGMTEILPLMSHRKDVLRQLRTDRKPRLRLGGLHKLTVMTEDNIGAVSSFQRHFGGVLNVGQAIADERMPQAVILPRRLCPFDGRGPRVKQWASTTLPNLTRLASVG